MSNDRIFRKHRKRLTAGSGVIALALAVTGCEASANESTPETTLHFQELFAPGNSFADADSAYSEAVMAETNGDVEFKFHWSSSVVPSDQVAGAMDDELIDMARLQPPASPADYPVTNWLAGAANQSTDAFPAGLLQQIGAHLEFAVNSTELSAELEQQGIRYIAPLALIQQYDLLCDRPISSLEDFQGTRVRVAGSAWVNEMHNVGAEPVSLPAEEIYEGYQRGVVDCVMTYPSHYVDSGLWELGGYHVPLHFTGWNQDAIAISQTTWATLPADTQEALEGQSRVWIEEFVQRQLHAYWQFVVEGEDHGIEFLKHNDEIQSVVDDYHETLRDELIAAAPAQVSDPERLLDEYEGLHNEWLPIVEELGYDTELSGLTEWVDSLEDPTQPPDINLDPWLDIVMERAFGHSERGD